MSELQQLTQQALAREASRPAIEFEQRWITWGDLRQVAVQLTSLLDATGVDPHAPIAFVPRNRPSAIGALLGLIARGRSIRMIYAFQSATALARDVERLKPAVIVAAAQDYSAELLGVLRAEGIAAIALSELHAAAVPGFERTRRPAEPTAPASPRIEILTSGTTGPPKQFAISYDLIAKHMVGSSVIPSSHADDVLKLPPTLFLMPLGNISGVYSTLPALLKGQRAVLMEKFTVAAWH
ncbi:MAG TPA: AMP-binding protein, partial [Steroidobacter sp.]|nr:AMP-binding protein [Steroidobacter sp.]